MDDRTCGYCSRPLPLGTRSNQRYCGRTHKRQARRQVKRREEMQASLVARSHPSGDMTLSELDARRHEHQAAQDPGDDLREFSDYGELPEDDSYPVSNYDGGQDEQTARVHQMIAADAERRTPRRPWSVLRKMYAANPGVEAAEISRERVERHQAEQATVKARLRSAPGQVEDRFNEYTRDAVAHRANVSRKLNKVYATADPRPPAQRQAFAWDEAEQASWDAFGGGRAPGQRARHADYAWRMDDGFRY